VAPSIDRDLTRLETDLKQLEAEYNMFFSGRLPKPPWETRARVEALVKQFDRGHIPNAAFIDLWDRGLRAREEGRPGPFAPKRTPVESLKRGPDDRIVHVSSFRDPVREIDKLTELYESLAEARREVGEDAPPFHKFADLVKNQVKKLRDSGSPEVAFRVAVKDGKVSFTARGLKGVSE
jgi:hypothetical protein